MKVGIPKEIKNNENRVGMTPAGVAELVRRGHEVILLVRAADSQTTNMWLLVRGFCLPSKPCIVSAT